MEQVGPLAIFFLFNFCAVVDAIAASRRRAGSSAPTYWEVVSDRVRAGALLAVPVTPFLLWLYRTGYFGPLSVRVRALFLKHTRTGNPLVDSVAEHQVSSLLALISRNIIEWRKCPSLRVRAFA